MRGPSERRRHLYAEMAVAIVMYVAPIWADATKKDKKIYSDVKKVLKRAALRVICTYRIVSHPAAAILTWMIPFKYLASRYRSLSAS